MVLSGRERIIEVFNKYKFELTNDGFIEFGIVTSSRDSLNEVFVSSFKYMKIWTDRAQTLIDTLNELSIIDNLQFIDEFPAASEALALT